MTASQAYESALQTLTAKGFKPSDGPNQRAAFIEEDRVSVFSYKVKRACYGHPQANVTGYRCAAYPSLSDHGNGWHFVGTGA